VGRYRKPALPVQAKTTPPSSDEFDGAALGPQWQWQANPDRNWWSLAARPGALRLFPQPLPDDGENLWPVAALLLQKPPAEEFAVTTELTFTPERTGERAGLLVFGTDYAWIGVERTEEGRAIVMKVTRNAPDGGRETEVAALPAPEGPVELGVTWSAGGRCRFSARLPKLPGLPELPGQRLTPFGPIFEARPGRWVGAKVGLFAAAAPGGNTSSPADFAWFRVTPRFEGRASDE
jgi:hypothetical protein